MGTLRQGAEGAAGAAICAVVEGDHTCMCHAEHTMRFCAAGEGAYHHACTRRSVQLWKVECACPSLPLTLPAGVLQRRAVASAVAEVASIRAMFDAADVSRDGALSEKELAAVLKQRYALMRNPSQALASCAISSIPAITGMCHAHHVLRPLCAMP